MALVAAPLIASAAANMFSQGGAVAGMNAPAAPAGSSGATFGGSAAGGNPLNVIGQGVDILAGLFGTHGTTSTQKTNASYERQLFSDEDLGGLRDLVASLTGRAQAGQFSKEAAILDTQSLGDAAVRQLKEQALPQLFSSDVSGGAYDSTATKQLANDLAARTADNIAQTRIQAILGYGQMESQQFADLMNVLQILRGAFEKGSTESKTKSESGGSGGLLGGGGLF